MSEQSHTPIDEIGWVSYKGGQTLGQVGSEEGVIVHDEELLGQARITVEKQARHIPFAVTFGVYGLLVHTHYVESEAIVTTTLPKMKAALKQIVDVGVIGEGGLNAYKLGKELIETYS